MANLNNHIMTFIKLSVITTLTYGGLLAQSYATSMISASMTSDGFEQTAVKTNASVHKASSVSQVIHNTDTTEINFDLTQFAVKALESQIQKQLSKSQLFIEFQMDQLENLGQVELEITPKILVVKNNWAQFEMEADKNYESFKLNLNINRTES